MAGIFAMPYWPFQLANVTSAFVWAAVVLGLSGLGFEFLIGLWK
jgi:membrane protein DedA with SNARE-associated domain